MITEMVEGGCDNPMHHPPKNPKCPLLPALGGAKVHEAQKTLKSCGMLGNSQVGECACQWVCEQDLWWEGRPVADAERGHAHGFMNSNLQSEPLP